MVVVLNFLAVWFVFMCRLKLTKVSKEFSAMCRCVEKGLNRKNSALFTL
jgi:hypothetical protein